MYGLDRITGPDYSTSMAWFEWLFSPKRKPDPDDFVHEKWESRFGLFQEKRFEEESSEHFQTHYNDKGLNIELNRQDLFSWSINPLFQYRDLVLEGDLVLDSSAYGAAGFVVRFTNEDNYYYALVSNRGYFRFDVVFNGEPICLLPWIPLPAPFEPSFTLTVLAHGDHFTFMYNKDWIGEVLDDHLTAGRVGFAAQVYHEGQGFSALLRRVTLESRPLEVEAFFQRWVQVVPPEPEQRRTLAQVFFGQGFFAETVRQVRKNSRVTDLTREDKFLMANALVRQGLYTDALPQLDELIASEPQWKEALSEKAGLLYLQSRYFDLKEFLEPQMELFSENINAWNLLGHAYLGVGNWEKGCLAYTKAWELSPQTPLIAMNLARCHLKSGKTEAASGVFLAAAWEFYRQEAWADLQSALVELKTLKVKGPESLALEGLWLYQVGEYIDSLQKLTSALEQGYEDSAVHYVLGLILRDTGKPAAALPHFERATSLEPDFVYYQFRLAETRHLLGQDPGSAAEKAIQGAPNDPWILNFQGQLETDVQRSVFYFEKSHLSLPNEPLIAANLAQAYTLASRRTEAFKLLENFPQDAHCQALWGDIFASLKEWEDAQRHYEWAVRLAPEVARYKENAAEVALALEQFSRAEELLIPLVETSPNARVITALGDLAWKLGDFTRAEVALRTALELDDTLPTPWQILGDIYLARNKWDKLETHLDDMLKRDIPEQGLRERYLEATHEKIQCATCGLEWQVPRVLGPQGGLRLEGEPPAGAPAGQSPITGKVYCIGCAQQHLKGNRFICPESGQNLNLSDDRLIWLLKREIAKVQA